MTRRQSSEDEIREFFSSKVPSAWFVEPVKADVDNDEVLVVGRLDPVPDGSAGDRIAGFREETRDERIGIAAEAERRFGRKVSWGAECGETRQLFTTASVPFMTRLRMEERAVLDTLVAAGVARSRSEALGWCVKQVAANQAEWLKDLRDALVHVETVRASGPGSQTTVV